jgi:hypothetical protein
LTPSKLDTKSAAGGTRKSPAKTKWRKNSGRSRKAAASPKKVPPRKPWTAAAVKKVPPGSAAQKPSPAMARSQTNQGPGQ